MYFPRGIDLSPCSVILQPSQRDFYKLYGKRALDVATRFPVVSELRPPLTRRCWAAERASRALGELLQLALVEHWSWAGV